MKLGIGRSSVGQQHSDRSAAYFQRCSPRVMRTRARAGSPGPEHHTGPLPTAGGIAPGHQAPSNIHSRYGPHSSSGHSGTGNIVQPPHVVAHNREALTDSKSRYSWFMQRLSTSRKKASSKKMPDIRIMGLEPSPELVAISMVYFVQGILGLSRLAVSYFFKDELHIDPAEVAFLTGLSSIPWMVKPLYGFISDSVPLFGYRRRSYLVLCGLMGTVAWGTLSYGVHDATGAVACMLLASLGTAAADVVVDSIVVERARGHPQSVAGSLQSLCWASAALGGITSAYFSGSFVQDYGCRFVFGLTAFFPLAVSASSLLIDEKRAGHSPPLPLAPSLSLEAASCEVEAGTCSPLLAPPKDTPGSPPPANPPTGTSTASHHITARLRAQATALWGAVRRKEILMPAVFVYLWQSTPSSDSAMFYYQTTVLGFTPEFLGRVRLGGALASLAGVALFNTWLKAVPLRRMLWCVMLIGTLLSSSQLILISGLHRAWGISDQVFVLGDSMVLTVLGQVSWMPILVLAARLCPEGVEATLFATLMSVLNCGSITGGALGAALTKLYGVTADKYDNLFALVATCVALGLAPAPFLRLLPPDVDLNKEAAEAGKAGGGAEGSNRRSGGGEGAGSAGEGPGGSGAGGVEVRGDLETGGKRGTKQS